jgi:hypothetical protein
MARTYLCSVNNCGPNQDGNVLMYLTGRNAATGETIRDYYMAAPLVKKEVLATGLVAMANRRKVLATLDTTTSRSQIREILVTMEQVPESLADEVVEVGTEVEVEK